MKFILSLILSTVSITTLAGGLTGVESGDYYGINNDGAPCLLEITRSEVVYYNVDDGNSYIPYVRRQFEYNATKNSFIHTNVKVGNIKSVRLFTLDGVFTALS